VRGGRRTEKDTDGGRGSKYTTYTHTRTEFLETHKTFLIKEGRREWEYNGGVNLF
jgi:hypothetical protein